MKYTIPTYKLKAVCKKLEDLNKRIDGMEGQRIEYTVGISYQKPVQDVNENDKEITRLVDVVDIELINPVVSLNGWSFLAVIEHNKNGNMVMKKLYDVEIPEQYWNSDTYCEHCNVDRYRKNTYLVYRADTKEIHQVGSTCLTVYLGFDASLMMAHAMFLNNLSDMMNREHTRMCRRAVEVQELDRFLKKTIVWVNKLGYVSAKKARENNASPKVDEYGNGLYLTATGVDVWGLKYCKEKTPEWIVEGLNDEHIDEKYNQIIEWVKGQEPNTDYIRNIKTLVERGFVTNKTATTAASIVGVWYAKQHENDKKEPKKISNHVGEIRKRMDFDMVLKTATPFESTFGASTCYRFETEEGNIIVWFTGSVNLEVGKRYVGKGTVTKHDEYNGIKQTIINRAKLNVVE